MDIFRKFGVKSDVLQIWRAHMRNTIPIKPDANSLKHLPFLLKSRGKKHQESVWNLYHCKTLRTAGRGGKGHFVGGVNHGWNRKGRW